MRTLSLCFFLPTASSFAPHLSSPITTPLLHPPTHLWGLLDRVTDFLSQRDGDFIKLEESIDIFGPGPAVVLYHVPQAIGDDELQEMLEDGAPQASAKGVTMERIDTSSSEWLDLSLKEALDGIVANQESKIKGNKPASVRALAGAAPLTTKTPVLLYSGFSNKEMMDSYNIIGGEIYQESGAVTACAKAVPNSMDKPLRRVLEEISGDHQDAMSGRTDSDAE